MVRSGFAKVPVAQRRAIVSAATEEFAAHGFHNASLNRILEATGTSKGSMYHYFDGKSDLFAYVVRVELEQLMRGVEPLDLTTTVTADAFWSALATYYLDLMSALRAAPQLAAMIRAWIAASGTSEMQHVQKELETMIGPWMQQVLATGQGIGAVRDDLPPGLLIAVAGAMGQAIDTWLMTQAPEAGDLPRLTSASIGMIRRALEARP
ncbi:MAG TPA: TetR/AcrR family transcriptional regulator [Amnibacterium sp.]|jgi:AcrR family transcriptional regulator|uniref:TetR/AcrR family transcriptional regulator n=1 Tax=Amnibacterium sp. TaxID=1872496 RepID=UPI002F93CDBC